MILFSTNKSVQYALSLDIVAMMHRCTERDLYIRDIKSHTHAHVHTYMFVLAFNMKLQLIEKAGSF